MFYYLLAAVVAAAIFMYWDDHKNWESVYETTGHAVQEAHARFSYLKNNGVKCRLKSSSSRGIHFGGLANPSMVAFVKLEVHKKDLQKARGLLAKFR